MRVREAPRPRRVPYRGSRKKSKRTLKTSASADASVLSVSNAAAAALMYGPHALAPVVSASAKRKEAPDRVARRRVRRDDDAHKGAV